MTPPHIKYSRILVDVLNLLHKLKNTSDVLTSVNDKRIYKQLLVRFIDTIKYLENEYLLEDGSFYLLFDNPTSRIDLQKSFYYAQRKHIYPKYKEQRAREVREFYNTFDLLRYYYLVQTSKFKSIQVKNVEADDLVKPTLDIYCKNESVLMVTNDYDWTRYLNQSIDWLPDLGQPPETVQDFINKKGFYPTEQSVIAYKSIFGDKSDNIPKLIAENSTTLTEFIEIYHPDPYLAPDSLILKSCSSNLTTKYTILKAIKENENQYRINIQLTSTIPISEQHIRSVTCEGRNATVIIDAVEIILGIKEKQKEFVFGGIKRPKL